MATVFNYPPMQRVHSGANFVAAVTQEVERAGAQRVARRPPGPRPLSNRVT